jgi:hypothetical protein
MKDFDFVVYCPSGIHAYEVKMISLDSGAYTPRSDRVVSMAIAIELRARTPKNVRS